MSKSNSDKSKTNVILPVLIITAVTITGVILANPLISFVSALQKSYVSSIEREGDLVDQIPKINGSINVFEKAQAAIENDLKTSFVEAAEIVTRLANNDTILLGGHLDVDQGYLVYKFFSINSVNHTAYKTIIDAGNGAVLYKSDGIQFRDFFNKSSDQSIGWHIIPGFTSEYGYGQGAVQDHKPFGFGHWKGPWGFHGHGGNNGVGPWH